MIDSSQKALCWYVPNSTIPIHLKDTISTDVANRTPESLLALSARLLNSSFPPIKKSSDFFINKRTKSISNLLGELFTKFGSDKSIKHNYHFTYGHIISSFNRPLRLLEIGLGTTNQNIPDCTQMFS